MGKYTERKKNKEYSTSVVSIVNEDIRRYRKQLATLLTDNFEIISV
jgi:hypothetical protein